MIAFTFSTLDLVRSSINISDSIHEETQTESLDTILKNGDTRTAPRKVVPKLEIKKELNMTAINELA